MNANITATAFSDSLRAKLANPNKAELNLLFEGVLYRSATSDVASDVTAYDIAVNAVAVLYEADDEAVTASDYWNPLIHTLVNLTPDQVSEFAGRLSELAAYRGAAA